jgi:hypothetical protein
LDRAPPLGIQRDKNKGYTLLPSVNDDEAMPVPIGLSARSYPDERKG